MADREGISSYLQSNSELRKRTILDAPNAFRSSCGYCKSEGQSSAIYGARVFQNISCEDYEEWLNRGWRRSGRFIYKPILDKTCCPHYPIRLPISSFVPNKQQRAVVHKLQRYLATGTHRSKSNPNFKRTKRNKPTNSIGIQCKDSSGNPTTTLPAYVLYELNARIRDAVILACQKKKLPVELCSHDAPQSAGEVRVITTRSSAKFRRASCPPPDLCCPLPLKLAGMLNSSPLTSNSSPKSKLHVVNDFSAKYIGNILAQQMNVPKWASVIVAKNGFMNFYLRDDAIREEVQRAGSTMNVDNSKLEMATPHEAKKEFNLEQSSSSCTVMNSNNGPQQRIDIGLNSHVPTKMNSPSKELHRLSAGLHPHVLSVSTVQPMASDEVLKLYQKYQMTVHGDTLDVSSKACSRTKFEQFLVDSPLSSSGNDSPPLVCSTAGNTNNNDSNTDVPCGSYHQHYRIDGQLVAVGVIDILPTTLTSGYCFYDPDFHALSLGKVVALKEINWAQSRQQVCPDLQYYSLGYYVHSCPKMAYKGKYAPAELLSPSIPGVWFPLDKCKPLLDKNSHDRLQLEGVNTSVNSETTHKETGLEINDETMEHAVNSILFLSGGIIFTFKSFFSFQFEGFYEYFENFVRMVGPDMVHRVVLCFS